MKNRVRYRFLIRGLVMGLLAGWAGTASATDCGSSTGQNTVEGAIAWAEAQGVGDNEDECHDNRPWAGWCLHFVGHCYLRSPAGYARAIDAWNTNDSTFGLRHNTGDPPRGALVFFGETMHSAGHVGLSTGDGRMWHAWTDGIRYESISLYQSDLLGWRWPIGWTPDLPNPLNVVQPNGGQTWVMGKQAEIEWATRGTVGSIQIHLYKGGTDPENMLMVIVNDIPPDNGSYIWTIPCDLWEGSDYKVGISEYPDGEPWDFSDNYFAIVPGLDVTYPNGGDVWLKGLDYPISWELCGDLSDCPNVAMHLYKDGTSPENFLRAISASTPNDGSFVWSVDCDLPIGDKYYIGISDAIDGDPWDFSNSPFSIMGSCTSTCVIYVPQGHSTIQSAIDAATDGCEIIVSPATYYENVHFLGKNIILRSTDPTNSSVVAGTIINGNHAGSVVTFSGTENATCVLSGFTITNGYARQGGGICGNGTLATIHKNNITTNTAHYSIDIALGGGLYGCTGAIQNNTISGNLATHGGGLADCEGTIRNNSISGNLATYGGGLYNCGGVIQNNSISDNSASIYGGGLNYCNTTILNNTITGNSAQYGGGLYDCYDTIQSNTITGNSASIYGGGLYGCDGTVQNNTISMNLASRWGGGLSGCDGTIQNNTITGNSGGGLAYCNGIIKNNTITNNSTFEEIVDGGGLYQCDAIIQNNTISGNRGRWGGGLAGCLGTIQNNLITSNSGRVHGGGISGCNAIIQNNTIWGNSAPDGGGLYRCQGTIRNCIIWQNTALTGAQLYDCVTPSYSCIQDWTGGGTGNIADVPLLVDPGNGDFHLDYGSPCIDAGCIINDLPNDFEGDPRGFDGSVEPRGDGSDYDIGADEFTAILANHRPHKPINLSPANGEAGVPFRPTLESSAFSDPDTGDFHTATHWQIDNNSDFSSPEYDSGTDFSNLTIITLSENLMLFKEYYWRVKHRDNHGYWSEWSDPTSFSPFVPEIITVPSMCPNIQTAIDAAIDGCEIIVSPGTYDENIHFLGKNIILRSSDPMDPSIVASTIIDANVTFSGTELTTCVLSGLTITNGYALRGGGINGNGTMATIQNNIISGNSAHYYGGGLYDCDGIIQNNTIEDNSADTDGGGLDSCDGTILNNIISGNRANRDGAGLNRCNGTIRNNTISGNSTNNNGGGVHNSYGIIQNNTIEGNSAGYGGGLDYCEIIENNIISNNLAEFGGGLSRCNTVRSNTIEGNGAEYGGGLYGCDLIQNNTISGNTAEYGGGLYGCHYGIQNNIILGNSAGYGGGLNYCNGTIHYNTISENSAFCGGGLYDCGIVQNNIISGNSAVLGGGLNGCHGTVQNNTISGNSAIGYLASGGGLYECTDLIENNSISENYASVYGGGISSCDGTIQNNTISGNSTESVGGGLIGCDGTVQNNTISANSARFGGGISSCNGTIQNNTISENNASGYGASGYGGGISSCDGTILNNTIWDNSADSQGGGLMYCWGTIKNCIIWQNTAPSGAQLLACASLSYSCIQDWTGSTSGNISFNPQLIDPSNGNFHLKPNSPCVDAACYIDNLTQDFEGDPRPWDGTSELRGDGSDFDIGADEFIGSINYDFTDSEEGWTHGSAAIFSSPEWRFEAGNLMIVSQTNTNTFGFWQSPENAIPIGRGYLYRARFNISTDITDQSLVPQIRLRANSLNLQQYDVLSIESAGMGDSSPMPSGTDYDLYFVPPANDTAAMLAFDLLNFNPFDAAMAELALDTVSVDRFPLASLPVTTMVQDYTFDTGAEGWTSGGAPIVFTSPEYNHIGSALELRTTTNTNTFGFWGNDPADITIDADKLYRGTFEVRTDVTNPVVVPEMRLRFNAGNLQASRMFGIASAGDGANSPGTTNTTYDRLYFLPPANCVGQDLLISFDILNFNPDDAAEASLILDRAIIETLSLPALP